jgi:hypothetical protein
MPITAAQGLALRAQVAQMDRHQDLAGRHVCRAIASLEAERKIARALDDPYATEQLDDALTQLRAALVSVDNIRS